MNIYRLRTFFIQGKIFTNFDTLTTWIDDNITEDAYAIDELINHKWVELYTWNGCI